MKQKFNISGMSCSACSANVDKTVRHLNGVKDVNVSLLANQMEVDYDEAIIDELAIENAVNGIGYKAFKYSSTNIYEKKSNQIKLRLYASSILMIILFYISMGHMFNWPLPAFLMDHNNSLWFALLQLFISTIIYGLNFKYFSSGFKALFKKHPNMDSLIAIGALAAYLYGLYAIYQISLGNHFYAMDLYFETGAMILTLVTVGKYIESNSKKKTSDAIEKLVNLRPKMATVKKDNQELLVPIEDVQIGDIVIIKAGETIACDGFIVSGNTSVDQAMITGESLPVEKNIGDEVIGATNNLSGYIEIQVSKTIADSTLSKIIELVEHAASSKAPIAKFADQISAVFVPIVIGIASVTFLFWLFYTGSFEEALSFAIAVLVISCPCALGIATPSAIMVSTGMAAQNGILIKEAKSLEQAKTISTIILDKTGTITMGKPQVIDVITYDDEFEKIAYALETLSDHPFAKAIVNKYAFENTLKFDSFTEISGRGIVATINNDNYIGGNIQLMRDYKVDIDQQLSVIDDAHANGQTCLMFAKNQQLLGIMLVADAIKPSSNKAIASLKSMGIKTIMLTGDNQLVAANIASTVGVDEYRAEVLPQDKQAIVMQYQALNQVVAMVGDGINDSPALMRADIGIAIGSGSDIAVDAADIILIKNDLMDVVSYIQLSKQTLRNIKENLFFALVYNTLGIPLAAGLFFIPFGLRLSPMFGAFAMSLSSISVVLNALRLRNFKPKTIDITPIGEKEIKMKKQLTIEGMSCNHCRQNAENALNSLVGVKATVDLASKTAIVESDHDIDNAILIEAIELKGYRVVDIKTIN